MQANVGDLARIKQNLATNCAKRYSRVKVDAAATAARFPDLVNAAESHCSRDDDDKHCRKHEHRLERVSVDDGLDASLNKRKNSELMRKTRQPQQLRREGRGA